jgi:hypothetical protein
VIRYNFQNVNQFSICERDNFRVKRRTWLAGFQNRVNSRSASYSINPVWSKYSLRTPRTVRERYLTPKSHVVFSMTSNILAIRVHHDAEGFHLRRCPFVA